MCGIIGIVAKNNVNQDLYDGLTVLQHRGQDAAGIVTYDDKRLHLRKDNGLVKDVFSTNDMMRLRGNMGIGHVRYPTAGSSSSAEAQPLYVNSPYGIALAHNGNLTNANELKEEIYNQDLRHLNTDSDSEVLLNVFAHEIQTSHKLRINEEDVFNAIRVVHKRCRGAYASVAMITGYGIVGFRDPHGIRPVVYGKRDSGQGVEYCIASESVALDVQGFELIDDIKPGEAVIITAQGEVFIQQCAENTSYNPCIFEHVYFARPDSIMDNISVYKARLRMGEKLAKKILKIHPDHDIDVVMPIPDTSRSSALELANALGVRYREGFIKNRYIGRTFIMPGQKQRKSSVKKKLNAMELEFKGRNVLLVDDSIVRGTTSSQIVKMAREAGAKKVFFASASPAVKYPNVYGIDMPSPEEFVAHQRSSDEIAKEIGADWLIYQDLEDLIQSCQRGNKYISQFDCSVFNGEYVTGDIDQNYLNDIDKRRNDKAMQSNFDRENEILDIHNS
ncbi:MAG: amidophosphoribosyltransferase [gamma proteobacterium symbiont of Bathyaustriella thionipta]|nr:amidophosphoribosyltransferase [gamma proteobacterium symbiont of Bathyaustriella thionipta]MCU7950067.1 amidophosphoribosyltransferase [gamma proteobacterium symbiont of Bathyaustriella thionipta]MCU7952552.1 amidophosphoribosyltransferase [gamma proteobacterium symbiont of Bathyaustriella thionipta]MCU7957035.1 amidophosphoribosyltransferase [gamma proteobacterium symbiont of Bathyaustriella thionipta]MCU7967411.1 amidophosphoribosyltransferase [gamma proteobacterium symbiont of Bathyaustr